MRSGRLIAFFLLTASFHQNSSPIWLPFKGWAVGEQGVIPVRGAEVLSRRRGAQRERSVAGS